MKSSKPEAVHLTAEEADALQTRIASNKLNVEDLRLLSGLVSLCLWLQDQLEHAKLGIRRLKSMFGFSTEKSPTTPDSSSTTTPPSDLTPCSNTIDPPPEQPTGDSEPSNDVGGNGVTDNNNTTGNTKKKRE